MSEWTPAMSDEVRKAADRLLQEGNPVRAFILHQMVGAIESQRAELEASREISNSLYELHGVLRWHFEHQLISDSDGMGQLLYGAMVDLDTAVRKHGLARDNAPIPPFTPRDDALHSQHATTGEDTK